MSQLTHARPPLATPHHLPIDLITKTKAKVQALGVHPSELVAEVLRRWLAEEDAS